MPDYGSLLHAVLAWAASLSTGEQLAVVGLLAALTGTLFKVSRGQKRDRERFEQLFFPVRRERIDVNTAAGLKQEFFTGKDVDRNCLQYVGLDFDAPRALMNELAAIVCDASTRLTCIQVVAPRQCGKTMAMARVAFDLTTRARPVFWGKFGAGRTALSNPDVIRRVTRQRTWYLTRPRFFLFIDDPVAPTASAEDVAAAGAEAANLVESLRETRVTVVISGPRSLFPNRAEVRTFGAEELESSPFALTKDDLESIVGKWQQHQMLDSGKAAAFLQRPTLPRLARRRIFAFLSLLYRDVAEAPHAQQFMAKFAADYERVPNPRGSLLPIAACQLVDVSVPSRLVNALAPGFALNNSIVSVAPFDGDPADPIHMMAGPFVSLWVLTAKLGCTTFEDLSATYSAVLRQALAIPNFGYHRSERFFIPVLIHALAKGRNEDLFGGRSLAVARALLREFRDEVEGHFVGKVVPRRDSSELIFWGRMFKRVAFWDLAEQAYLLSRGLVSAESSISERLMLAKGLAAMPARSTRTQALPFIEALLRELPNTGYSIQLRRQVFHIYMELLQRLGEVETALRRWDELLAAGAISPDPLLWMQVGRLYEGLGDAYLESADRAYAAAVESAESGDARTLVHVLQRYGVFLARHPVPGRPACRVLFRRALRHARTHGVVSEPIVTAWAEYVETQHDHRTAKRRLETARRLFERAVRSYQRRGTVEAHAWGGLATLLIDHARQLPGRAADHLNRAEELCRQVVSDESVGWRSKRYMYHVLGRLLGMQPTPYRFGELPRPAPDEAVTAFELAFESPPGVRDDPRYKTWQDVQVHRALWDLQGLRMQRYLGENEGADFRTDTSLHELMRLVEYHARASFEGLPRPDTPGDNAKEHVLTGRDRFAFVLYRDKRPCFPEQADRFCSEAQELHRQNLADLKEWGWSAPLDDQQSSGWRLSYLFYMHYATFLSLVRPEDHTAVVRTCHQFAACLPYADLKWYEDARDEVRRRLGELSRYLVRKGNYYLKGSQLGDLETALQLQECLMEIQGAWLKRFPDDADIRRYHERAINFRERIAARLKVETL